MRVFLRQLFSRYRPASVRGAKPPITELDLLRALGCDSGQGYLFSPALDVYESRALVAEGQHRLRPDWGYPAPGHADPPPPQPS